MGIENTITLGNQLKGKFMDIIGKIIDVIRPSYITGPVFIKEDSDAIREIDQLKSLLEMATGETKTQIESDIRLLNYGVIGENNIAFELKNSHLPMLILHDLNLIHQGLSAQIDYVIIIRNAVVIIECKNLFGNIEVNSNGDFIRSMEFNGRVKKEGIYSPITQNKRHFDLIKQTRMASSTGFIDRLGLEKGLAYLYRTIVVLANPKTVINMKFAKKEIKDQIIRADQLITYLKKLQEETRGYHLKDNRLYDIADFFLKLHINEPKDYTSKYKINANKEVGKEIPIEETEIYKALKEYRLLKCREKQIKAFIIYSNAQLEEIIKLKPIKPEDLIKVSGFNKQRVIDYGKDIIDISKKYL